MTLHQRAKLIVFSLLPTGLDARDFEFAVTKQGKLANEIATVYEEFLLVRGEARARTIRLIDKRLAELKECRLAWNSYVPAIRLELSQLKEKIER